MDVAEALQRYLDETGESMRGLSLRAGLGEKAVSDIIRLKGSQPKYRTLQALSEKTGIDFSHCMKAPPVTFADLISRLTREGETRKASRIKWVCREAGWVPETEVVCRRTVVDFFEKSNAARFGLTPGSYSTYKHEAIDIVSTSQVRARRSNVADLDGVLGEFHEALKKGEMEDWRVGLVGTFLVFLHDRAISPADVSSETLEEYYAYRLTISTKSEKRCKDHVKEIALFLRIVSQDPVLSRFGFRSVPHPFEKSNGKYGVDTAVIAHLLAEYDRYVAPWARGEMSRDGVTRDEFIAALEKSEMQPTDRKALLLAKRSALAARAGEDKHVTSLSHDELLAASGFLTSKRCWSERTVEKRRGYIVSLAKSIVSTVDIVPANLQELLDPDFLDTSVQAIGAANSKEFPSGYIGSILKSVRKIAVDFQCRPEGETRRIQNLAERFTRKKRGIAPRNRAKLRKFDAQRIQTTIDFGDTIITGVNREIDRRRRAHQREHGVLPKRFDVIDRELARDIMAVIAHETLLRCAPRSDNLIHARLDWIGWEDDLAVLTIPACDVKMRDADDEDLRLPLGERVSRLLRLYLDHVRAKALLENDGVNPYLFPRQSGRKMNQPYKNILKRVVTLLHRVAGIKINPHLYRHLIGWIWLKDSLNHLPKVQRLLGHAGLQTTIDYYAELDTGLVFDEWNAHLNNKCASKKRKAA